MIAGLVEILLFQGLGEIVSRFALPLIPGPVIGLVLLLAWFRLRRRVAPDVELVANALVQHLGLLFVPAAVGVRYTAAVSSLMPTRTVGSTPGRAPERRQAGMRAVRHIAVNVFRESVRDRVPYNLVLFAVLLIGASFLIGQLTAGQDVKIIKDLGLAAISVIGLLMAVFIGIGLVWKEVERRSIYSLLAKPIRRSEFIKVPSFSKEDAAGKKTCANSRAVSLRNMSWTMTRSRHRIGEVPTLMPKVLRSPMSRRQASFPAKS